MKKNKKKNKGQKVNKLIIMFSILGILLIAVGFTLLFDFNITILLVDNQTPILEEVKIKDYNEETKVITVDLQVSDNSLSSINCYLEAKNSDEKKQTISKKNICTFEVNNDDYNIYLVDSKNNKSEIYNLFENVNEVLSITINEEEYLAVDTKKNLDYTIEKIGNPQLEFISSNEDTIKINNEGYLTVTGSGTSKITIKSNSKEFSTEITSTNLIQTMEIRNKSFLPCKKYTTEEAKLIDKILESRVKKAGLQTRAGVVAAARFLLLEFPYKISYFPENGRMYTTSTKVDGEGRYYHKGLYLSTDKYDEIEYSSTGPAIWGCPLQIALGEEDQPAGTYHENGLDCSGFVAWTLYNGGFDVGDLGAGFSSVKNFSNIGELKNITMDLLKSNTVKAGDLIGYDGHTGIILAIGDDYVIIGDTLNKTRGLTARKFTFNNLTYNSYFTYIVLMDNVYKENGNYTSTF